MRRDQLYDADMVDLMARAQFRRFLFRILNLGDILQSTYGTEDRHLAMREGRRSLGLEILDMVAGGQPDGRYAVLTAALIEEAKTPKEAHNDRPDSRADDPDADD